MTFPGQPRFTSSGFTGDRAASFPASCLLQRLRLPSSGCPRNWSATGAAFDASPSIPEYCIFRLCRWGTSGSPRTFLSIGVADWWISGFPRISRLPAVPSPLSSGCPVSAATAGSMLSPRLRSNFASAAILLANPRVSPLHAPAGCAADESSSSIGSCNPCLTSRCNLNLFRSTTCGKPPVFSRVPLLPHLPALPELQSNSLQGHQLKGRLGPLNLCTQVQNFDKFVDFTMYGALKNALHS